MGHSARVLELDPDQPSFRVEFEIDSPCCRCLAFPEHERVSDTPARARLQQEIYELRSLVINERRRFVSEQEFLWDLLARVVEFHTDEMSAGIEIQLDAPSQPVVVRNKSLPGNNVRSVVQSQIRNVQTLIEFDSHDGEPLN